MTTMTTAARVFSTPAASKRKRPQPVTSIRKKKAKVEETPQPKSCHKPLPSKTPAKTATKSQNAIWKTPAASKTASKRHLTAKGTSQRNVLPDSVRRATTTARKRPCTPATIISRGDRFIPNRSNINLDKCRSALFRDASSRDMAKDDSSTTEVEKEYRRRMVSSMCNVSLDSLDEDACPISMMSFSAKDSVSQNDSRSKDNASNRQYHDDRSPSGHDILNVMNAFAASESQDKRRHDRVKTAMQRMKHMRKPVRELDAPGILSDEFVNLMDWNVNNVVAVGLGDAVFVYNYDTKASTEVFDDTDPESNMRGTVVTAVKWCRIPGKEHILFVATEDIVHVWDASAMHKLRTMKVTASVESLAFNRDWVTLGSVDGRIMNYDIRSSRSPVIEYRGHEGRVCSLKWNEGGRELASGGGDKMVCIWDAAKEMKAHRNHLAVSLFSERRQNVVAEPSLKFTAHEASVKALDWCPFSSHTLASGGAEGDGTIKVWNARSGDVMASVFVGSHATSLVWSTQSEHAGELITGHGCGALALWRYNATGRDVKQFAKTPIECLQQWQGHGSHVLDLGLNSAGMAASVSTDETLRCWNVFGEKSFNLRRNTVLPVLSTLDLPTIR